MASAANYNMLDFRSMYARTKSHGVTESTKGSEEVDSRSGFGGQSSELIESYHTH